MASGQAEQSADAAAQPAAEPGCTLVLDGLQSPINIGMILRVAETYQFRVAILDRFGVLADREKRQTIADFACGALERRGYRLLADEAALTAARRGGRLIATAIEGKAVLLPRHRFRPGDMIVLGNEYDGLSAGMVAGADLVLRIPMPEVWTPKPPTRNPIDPTRTGPVARDGRPNLNVALSAAIVCYSGYLSIEAAHAAG